MKSHELIANIRKDLNLAEKVELDDEVLAESYVVLPKTYNLATEFLSKKAKASHAELYAHYAERLTRVSSELDAVNRDDVHRFNMLKSEEIYNMNAVYLHELYFANISDLQSEIKMDTLPYMRLNRDFGTFDEWQYDFVSCSQGDGNGWAVCAFSTFLQKYINFFVSSHDCSIPVGCYPVIVLDVWEHAYTRDYGTDRKTYTYAMMKEFNWRIIEERFKRAEKIAEALR